nr:S-layer homology domain-containing protein [Oscillospiraceae bacterium]
MKTLFRRLLASVCSLALCLTAANALSVEQALSLLEEKYVDPLPDAAYEAESLDALFAAIGDPYTYYMTAAENAQFFEQVESENSITGIGATIEYTAEGILITGVLEGGGAKDAGLTGGDLILAVDGVVCAPAGEAHRALILGEAGSFVTLTVRHSDGSVQDHRIERRTVAIHNTNVTTKGDVGVINCDSFGSQTETYFADGVAQHGDEVSTWVVDLRSNLGGLADAAVGTLGIFTGAGPKLYYRLADGSSFYTLYLSQAQTDDPVIVLVNENSASASEIFSGGIRADQAGIVIGTRTYGKGTAQVVLDENAYPDLFDGDSLKVTAYRFYCSDGGTTDRIGVVPTLLVRGEYTDAVAALLSAAAPETDNVLTLQLNGNTFYVDLETAQREENAAALGELFSALAPDVSVSCVVDGMTLPLDPATVARQCGIRYTARGFSDSSTSPYARQIDTLATYGMLSGDGTGRFRPAQTLTRAEVATMLANALNVAAKRPAGFTDVPQNAWYAAAVDAMAHLGFMEGTGGGRFCPGEPLTQEQLIAVMGRLARFLSFPADDYARELTEDDLTDCARFH